MVRRPLAILAFAALTACTGSILVGASHEADASSTRTQGSKTHARLTTTTTQATTTTVPSTTTTTAPATTTTVPTTSPPAAITPTPVPASFSDPSCATDETANLTNFFAGLPAGAAVSFPANQCYNVSNTDCSAAVEICPSALTMSGLQNVTVEGNGATFKQTSYNGGVCNTLANSGPAGYILQLLGNTGLTIKDLTIDGPGNCSGAYNEDDTGIMLLPASSSSRWGNRGVTFDHVTIANTDGDGFSVMPMLATDTGLNTNIIFENGAMNNVGYHAIVPEGVDGLTITNNTFNHDGNMIDAEIDTGGGPVCNPCVNSDGDLNGSGIWNLTVSNNVLTNYKDNGSGNYWLEGMSSPCAPQENWMFQSNSLDATYPWAVAFAGPASTSCTAAEGGTYDLGLQFISNQATFAQGSGGSPPPPIISITGWSNVTIQGNTFLAWAGQTNYYPNSPQYDAIGLCAVANATVNGNTFNNTASPMATINCFSEYTQAASTGLKECNNTYWLTDPMYCDPNGTGVGTSGDPGCNGYIGSTPPPEPRNDGAC